MTIKEVEQRTGLPRASIRFYEKEGLLSPRREENGYRYYSSEDVQELTKLRLLRALGVSLDDIRSARTGTAALSSILEQQRQTISAETRRLEQAGSVCRRMIQERADYETLNASYYLEILGHPLPPESDAIPRVQAPWRRFFARELDRIVCLFLWYCTLTAVSPENFIAPSPIFQILNLVFILLLMGLAEPLLLHFFGTTPGKAVLGLSVSSPDGGRLTPGAAFSRTWTVLVWGCGLYIPPLEVYRNWKSFRECKGGGFLPWEGDSVLAGKAWKPWRAVLYILILALIMASTLGLSQLITVPGNRGNLDVADFSENYNQMARILAPGQEPLLLCSDGSWGGPAAGEYLLSGLPDFQYRTENGVLREVSFFWETNEQDAVIPDPAELCSTAMLAFVRAQRGLIAPGDQTEAALSLLDTPPGAFWETEANGVRITCRGYTPAVGILFPNDGETQFFSLNFTMILK